MKLEDVLILLAIVVVAIALSLGIVKITEMSPLDKHQECVMRLMVAQASSLGEVPVHMIEQSYVACNEIFELEERR